MTDHTSDDFNKVINDVNEALRTGRRPEDVQRERHARERNSDPLPEPVTVRPSGVTIVLDRTIAPHQPDDRCVNHCYSHHLDETSQAYLWCGECFHAFPTRRALRWDYIRSAIPIYLDGLRNPVTAYTSLTPNTPGDDDPFAGASINLPDTPDTVWARHPRLDSLRYLARLPFTRTRDITFCPHCIHDL